MPDDNRSRLLRNADAAAYLGLKPQTLRAYRVRGGGPSYHRLGRGPGAPVAYRLEDLDAWLSERRFTTTSQETAKVA